MVLLHLVSVLVVAAAAAFSGCVQLDAAICTRQYILVKVSMCEHWPKLSMLVPAIASVHSVVHVLRVQHRSLAPSGLQSAAICCWKVAAAGKLNL